MSRPRGGIIAGTLPAWTTTSTSGVFTLREAQELRAANTWPRGPDAPTSLVASAGNAQVSLSWTAPATTYGTITNYLVEYTASGGSPQYVLTGSTSTSYTLTGLTNGTAYTFRVAAVNGVGQGAWSAVTATPTAPPTQPFTSRTIFVELRNAGGASWSGTGTASNKLTPSQVFAYATLTVGVAGTLRITGNVNDGYDSQQHYIRKYGGSSLIASNGAFAINLSVSVTVGDVIEFTGDIHSNPMTGHVGNSFDRVFGETRDLGSACNIRVWIE